MKRIFSVLAALVICAIVFTGCDSNTPKNVADKWLTSFYHMEYGEAKKHSTPKTVEMLDMLEQYAAVVADSQKQNVKKIGVEIIDVQEEGEKAKVRYVLSDDNQEKSVNLVKENGKWLVNYTKQDSMDEGNMEEMEEESGSVEATENTATDTMQL